MRQESETFPPDSVVSLTQKNIQKRTVFGDANIFQNLFYTKTTNHLKYLPFPIRLHLGCTTPCRAPVPGPLLLELRPIRTSGRGAEHSSRGRSLPIGCLRLINMAAKIRKAISHLGPTTIMLNISLQFLQTSPLQPIRPNPTFINIPNPESPAPPPSVPGVLANATRGTSSCRSRPTTSRAPV